MWPKRMKTIKGDKRKIAWEFSFLRFPFINIKKGTNGCEEKGTGVSLSRCFMRRKNANKSDLIEI